MWGWGCGVLLKGTACTAEAQERLRGCGDLHKPHSMADSPTRAQAAGVPQQKIRGTLCGYEAPLPQSCYGLDQIGSGTWRALQEYGCISAMQVQVHECCPAAERWHIRETETQALRCDTLAGHTSHSCSTDMRNLKQFLVFKMTERHSSFTTGL